MQVDLEIPLEELGEKYDGLDGIAKYWSVTESLKKLN